MSKLRWAKFFWADWSNDTALRLCSMGARGLWMELLCIAAQGEPYGCVTIKGRPPTEAELRKLCHDIEDPHRNGVRRFRRWLAELEQHGVFQWVDIEPVDASGLRHHRVMCASRMRHDGVMARVRAGAARERWKLAENSQFSEPKPKNGAGLHMQKGNFASIEAESEAEEDPQSPPKPKPRRWKKKQDSGWTTLAKRNQH